MIWVALATIFLLLTVVFFIWTVSLEDGHWIVKRRSVLGRDRAKDNRAA